MKTALFVIDDDLARADELCLLLRFLEETRVDQADSSNWTAHTENNPDLRCIFLGRYGAGPDQPPLAALHAIRAAAPRVALILIEDAGQPCHLPAPGRSRMHRPSVPPFPLLATQPGAG